MLVRRAAEGFSSTLAPVLAAGSRRLVQTAAAEAPLEHPQQQQAPQRRRERPAAAPGVPSSLPEVRPAERAGAGQQRALCLSSINDPCNWGLGASPAGAADTDFFVLNLSSLSNPKGELPHLSRTAAPSPLPSQGFRGAAPGPTVQRKVALFRSSMMDPRYTSLAEPELPLAAFQTSMADPPLRRPGK